MDTAPQPPGLCRLAVDEGLRHPPTTQSWTGPQALLCTSLAPERGGTRCRAWCWLVHVVLMAALGIGTTIIPVLQVEELRLQEDKYSARFTQLLRWADSRVRAVSKLWGRFLGSSTFVV